MTRILFDEFEDAYNDIFLKIDSLPSFLQVADTHYLGDFLGGQYGAKEEIILDYLRYFKNIIQELVDNEVFIVFDLSDQYVGGLFVTKIKKGLIKLEYSWTKEIVGWGVSLDSLDEQVKEKRNEFQSVQDWLISMESIEQGLNWSIEKIK